MDLMEQLVGLMGKLPDGTPDEFKNELKGLFQKVNVDAGKAKTDLESYKKGDSQYKTLSKKLKEVNLTEDQLDDIANQLGYKKTLEDEHAILQAAYKESLKKNKENETAIKQSKMESILGRKFEEVAKAYKTPDGKTVKLADDFLDKKELYKDLDLDSELLVQDRIQKIAAATYDKQATFMQKLGVNWEGVPVHKVNVGDGNFGSGKALDHSAVKAVIEKSQGSADAAAIALTMYEQAAKSA